jgi:transcriptional regulator with XRE-family HTH domain
MNIGESIKRLRLENNLTQEELAARCELSKGFISLLERDLTSPSIATLTDILDILGTDLQSFFQPNMEEKIVFTKEDTFVKDEPDKGIVLEWLIPNAQKNQMEPILVNLHADSVLFEHNPHEGEEFGHVLQGILTIQIGNEHYKVKRGESFYYKSNSFHKIYNATKKTVEVLMVSAPPNF